MKPWEKELELGGLFLDEAAEETAPPASPAPRTAPEPAPVTGSPIFDPAKVDHSASLLTARRVADQRGEETLEMVLSAMRHRMEPEADQLLVRITGLDGLKRLANFVLTGVASTAPEVTMARALEAREKAVNFAWCYGTGELYSPPQAPAGSAPLHLETVALRAFPCP